jgi:hypothetical protein
VAEVKMLNPSSTVWNWGLLYGDKKTGELNAEVSFNKSLRVKVLKIGM